MFADDIIVYAENLKEWTKKKKPGTNKQFSKVAGYEVNIQKIELPV